MNDDEAELIVPAGASRSSIHGASLDVGTSHWALDVLANSHDAVVVIDERGHVLWFNAGAVRMFGYAAADVIGRDLTMLLPERFADIHRAHLRQFSKAGFRSRPMSARGVLIGRRSNGSEFPAAGTISRVSTDGGPVMTAILTDLTDRHNEAVRSEQLGRALDGSHVGLVIVDGRGAVVEANLACGELVPGWLHVELVGRSIEDVCDEVGVAWTEVLQAVAQQGLWTSTVAVETADHARRHLRLWVASHADSFSGDVGHVVTLVDATETMIAVESARRSALLLARSQQLARLATIEFTADLEVSAVSHEAADILDLRLDGRSVTYERLLEAFAPEHRRRVDDLLRQVAASDRPLDRQFSIRRRSGEITHVRLWAESFTLDAPAAALVVSIQDVTALQLRVEIAERAEQQLRAVLNAMTSRTAVLDDGGSILMVNDAWVGRERRCELGAGTRVGHDYLAAVRDAEHDGSHLGTGIASVLDGAECRFSADHRCSGVCGDEHWYMLTAERIDEPASGVVVSHRDITRRKRADAEREHRATHDMLTNLASRDLIRERIDRALHRTDGSFTAVMLADLDRFKVVNDSLGHVVGDRVLMTVARRFQAVTKLTDLVGRLGGDEFVVVCEDISGPDAASAVADRLLQALQLPVYIEGRELHVRASIGIAMSSASERDGDEMLRHADTAMYAAKRREGQRAVFFDEELGRQAVHRLELEHDLRGALARGEIFVAYQPQYDLQTGVLSGFEALCRWTHASRGPISPAEFIPIAEEIDLGVELGSWIMSESIHHLAACDPLDPRLELRMSVNVSPRQLVTPGFVDDVSSHLTRFGLAPERLELEIVESAVIENLDEIVDTMHRLRSIGVRLALDDFGTGTASLSQLSVLPVTTVKIDRSFIQNIRDRSGDPAIVLSSILAIAAVRNLDVIAEGIETQQQLDALRELGCQHGQGYLLGRPLARTDREPLPPVTLLW